MFPHLLAARTLELFSTLWESLQAHLGPYHTLYTGDEQRQGRMEDADRLPYTLDFLAIEELDYIQTLLNTTTIKRELDAQLTPESMASGNVTWITQILAVAVGYSQILTEDAELWELDVNIFLSEETSETANYSARNACGNLVAKLCSYNWPVLESLLSLSKAIYEDGSSRYRNLSTEFWDSVTDSMNSYKAKEAALYVVKQVLDEVGSYDGTIAPEVANAYLDFARIAMQDSRLLFWPG